MVSTSADKTTIVSAPGKVLMTGGYLVLDRQYSPGLVLTTTSRFFTQVESPVAHTEIDGENVRFVVDLESPQFHYSCRYEIALTNCANEGQQFWLLESSSSSSSSKRNPYIEDALLFSLAIANRFHDASENCRYMKIRIVADNDFYSQRENVCRDASARILFDMRCSPIVNKSWLAESIGSPGESQVSGIA